MKKYENNMIHPKQQLNFGIGFCSWLNTPIAFRALVPLVGWQPIAWAGPTADRCCRYCSPQDFLTFQVHPKKEDMW